MEHSVQYAETAGLDACEVDVPFYFDFVGEERASVKPSTAHVETQ